MKKNKVNANLILLMIVIIAIGSVGFSMAKYQTSLHHQTSASAANWNAKIYINNEEVTNRENIYELNLVDTIQNSADTLEQNTIAPGSNGNFDIKLDFTGSETGIEYIINLLPSNTEEFPENLRFYTSEDYSALSEIPINRQQLNYVPIDETGIPQIKRIYWIWQKVDNNEVNATEIAKSGKNIQLNLKITAQQYTREITRQTTDERYFDITQDGEVSLNQENILEFSTTVQNLVIPTKIGDINVASIAEKAFIGKTNILSVYISDGIQTVGESAFQDCNNLEYLNISDTVNQIGANAFYNCTKLKNVSIAEGLQRIENWVFDNCNSLETITLPQTVNYIGESAFYNCTKLQTINIPDNVGIINKWTFWNCEKLSSITIPNRITSIEEGAFGQCSRLATVNIGTGVTKICDSAFYMNTSLTNITIPANVLTIENLAFGNCIRLSYLTISDTTVVSDTAFENCQI